MVALNENPNDVIRRQILGWLYDRNAAAGSRRGKRGSCVKITDLKKGLKDGHGIRGQEVIANLNYLIDKGWVNVEEQTKQFRTRSGHLSPSVTPWYIISAAGIDKIEGRSAYAANHRYAGINITATGQNVVTLGDGNVIHTDHQALDRQLQRLRGSIIAAPGIDECEKLDASIDIETLREQLGKARPDVTILARLWDRIERIATASGFLDAVGKIQPLVDPLIQ